MARHTELVVGFDGSADARAALDWAVREAGTRHLALRIVHVEPDITGWDAAAATIAGAPVLTTALPEEGASVLDAALAVAAQAGIPARAVESTGSTAGMLVEESRSADLVVIGSRGHGAASSAVLGSTVSHLVSHAHCPVIVVRRSARRARGGSGRVAVLGVLERVERAVVEDRCSSGRSRPAPCPRCSARRAAPR
jgi:nucleotide-binding universal stress UspA family protein